MTKQKRKRRSDGLIALRVKVEPYKTKNGNITHFRTFYGATEAEARAKAEEYNTGTKAAPVFFDDLMNDFIINTLLPDPRYKDTTKKIYIDSYRKNLEPLPVARKQIQDITYQDIQKAYNAMTCRPASVNACHKLLRMFYALLIQQKIVNVDPTAAAVPPRTKRKAEKAVEAFTADELAKIRDYISREDLPAREQLRVDRFGLIIRIALDTGARISEILALTYDDIEPDKIKINKQVIEAPTSKDGRSQGRQLTTGETKTANSIRTIPIKKDLYKAVRKQRERHREEMKRNGYKTDLVFTSSAGKLIDKHNLRDSLNKIHKAAGVPAYGLHAYRRTFATRAAAAGVPLPVLSDLLGHSSITVTAQYYIGISDKEKRKAINKLK